MNILVTGGTGGLGRAAVELLAGDKNNHVWFTYCSSEARAKEIMDNLANTSALCCDYSDSDSVNAFVENIAEMDLDVLVNNAWVGKPDTVRFNKLATDDFSSAFQDNIIPTVAITQRVLERMRKKKSGRIITVLTSGIMGVPPLGYSLYASTKAYLAQLVKSWSVEYAKLGITSNAVSPDFMQTDFTADTDGRVIEQIIAAHPLKRLLVPEEVAKVIHFLVYASPQVNGVNIPITAGTKI